MITVAHIYVEDKNNIGTVADSNIQELEDIRILEIEDMGKLCKINTVKTRKRKNR